jgi:hypothetical protein
MIVGLGGRAGAGKSAAAAYLAAEHGFVRTRFAGPLKAMARGFLVNVGVDHVTIERMIEGDLKESPSEIMGWRTPRYFMQRLGTEFGREMISPTLWTDAWASHVRALHASGLRRIVVDDCRFENEVEAIHRLGGRVVCIRRPVVEAEAVHVSEVLPPCDMSLWNDGPIDILHARLDGIVARLGGEHDAAA